MSSSEERLSRYGWDRSALFYPTRDRDGALLGIFMALFVLHFGELFGMAGPATLLAGILPVEFAFQIVTAVLSVLFAGLLYRFWPGVDA